MPPGATEPVAVLLNVKFAAVGSIGKWLFATPLEVVAGSDVIVKANEPQ